MAPVGAEGEASIAGEADVGADADGEEDEVGGDAATVLEGDGGDGSVGRYLTARRRVGREGGEAGAGDEVDVVGAEFAFEVEGHFAVERREGVVNLFDDGDGQAAVVEGLGHFEADETGADDDGAARGTGGQICLEFAGVFHVAERKDVGGVDVRGVGEDGTGAGGEDELVVGEGFVAVGGEIADFNGSGGAVDAEGFGVGADVDVEAFADAGGGGDEEFVFGHDAAGNVVGESRSWRRR